MKRSQRWRLRGLGLVLLALCLVLPLVSCTDSINPAFGQMKLLSTSGVSIYRIVCSQDGAPDVIVDAADRTQAAMEHILGVDVSLVDDMDKAEAPDMVLPYEILIGRTARRESQEVLATLGQDEWVVRAVGHKIVILGETNRATLAAVDHFLTEVLGYKGESTPMNSELSINPQYDYASCYEAALLPNGNEDGALPGAPYGASVLYLTPMPENDYDALSLSTLQGLAAAYLGEHILLRDGTYEHYLPYLTAEGTVVEEADDAGQPWTLGSLLYRYRDDLDGYLLCNPSPSSESAYVAISLAHHLNAVVMTPDNEQLAIDAGLACVLDVTDKDDSWLRASQYFPLLDKALAVEQAATDAPSLVDYAVMTGCYCYYYDGSDEYLHTQKFKFLTTGAHVLLGEGANGTARVSSLANINLSPLDAAGLCNLSTLSGCLFTAPSLGQMDYVADNISGVHTVCLVMSDGEDLQWLMSDFTTSDHWFGSPLRGDFAINWGVPHTVYDIAPPLISYLGHSATENDDFVLQLPALGYTYAAEWLDMTRETLAKQFSDAMQHMLLRYAQIPVNGGYDAPMVDALTHQSHVQGVLNMGSPMSLGSGNYVAWVNQKPVVSMRYRMTTSAVDGTVEAIAEAINASSTEINHEDAYSVVVIDAKTGLDSEGVLVDSGDTMAAVAALVAQLDEHVDVVSVSEFMARVNTYLR